MVTWNDFEKIWASTSPLTPYDFSENNYKQGWNFVGATPPARQMWDSIQKQNDEKFKYLRDNFGTPNIVTSSSQMTDTDKVYVYMGSEAGWNSGHWYYYNEGTSSWEDGGVYNSVAFVTDPTLSIAGQPADAKATGDALALKSDLAGCTFTGNVSVNADFSVTGDSSFDDVSISGTAIGVTPTAGDNTTKLATTEYVQTELNDYLPLAGGTVTGNLSVNGTSTLTGNVSAGADVVAVGDVSSANIIASNNANIGGNATVTGSVASASLTTTADGTIGGNLSVSGTTTLTGDAVASADLSVAGDSALTKLSVSGTTALAGTSTAPTPSADDNSTKIATTEYVQTEIKPIETDVTINSKRISNIEKLLQGNLYDYQTDSTSAYTKTVPSGAMPYAGLEKVGGKTVVMNQAFREINSTNWTVNAIDPKPTANYNDGAVTVTPNAGGQYVCPKNGGSRVLGHVYYASCDAYVTAGVMGMQIVGGLAVVYSSTTNAWEKLHILFTATDSGTFYPAFLSSSYVEGMEYTIKNAMLVDLTLMFGSGNEPSTVEEFESMFPASYYAYNAGTLLSAGVTSVVSQGYNLFDKSTAVLGRFINWQNISAPSSISAHSDYIAVSPNQTYYLSSNQMAGKERWFEYDVNKTLLGMYSNPTSGAFTVGSRTCYIRFNMLLAELDTCVFNVSSTTNGTYKPYKAPITYPIPTAIRNLEGYGWSAGSVYNYIDFERKVFVQNVARVDLGSLTWTYQSGNTRFAANTPADAASSVTGGIPCVCAKYESYYTRQVAFSSADKAVLVNSSYHDSGKIFIKDSSYTDATTFTTAMSGVYLYYELATPIEVDISEYLTDDNLINVEAGGTLTFENSNGDNYRLLVPSEETYMIDLQEAINNG